VHCCPRAAGWGRIVVCLGAPVALQSLVYASGGSDLCRTEGCGASSRSGSGRANKLLAVRNSPLPNSFTSSIYVAVGSESKIKVFRGSKRGLGLSLQLPFPSREGGKLHAAPPI